MSTLTAEQEQKLQPFMDEFPWLLELIENNSTDEVISILKAIQLNKLIGNQVLPCQEDLNAIETLHELNNGEVYQTAVQAFTYGKIQGIRSERTRRKVKRMNV